MGHVGVLASHSLEEGTRGKRARAEASLRRAPTRSLPHFQDIHFRQPRWGPNSCQWSKAVGILPPVPVHL